jgi:hypothetical protein
MQDLTPRTQRAYVGREPDGNGFTGYVVKLDTEENILDEGGPWLDVEAALAWARERAAEVLLRYGFSGDTLFSAGDRQYGRRGEFPTWPQARNASEPSTKTSRVGRVPQTLTVARALRWRSLDTTAETQARRGGWVRT